MFIDLLVSPAFAADAAPQGNMLMNLLPLILLFAVFYFLLIRPQQKKAKSHKNMVASLKVGDEIICQGGMLGKIVEVDEVFLTVEIAPNVQVQVQRHGVTQLMPKGTAGNASQSSEKSTKGKSTREKSKDKTNAKAGDKSDDKAISE